MMPLNTNRWVLVVRWIARIAAIIIAGLIALIFVGEGLTEGFEPLLHLSLQESVMMIAFILTWLGLLLGWKWEVSGGLLTIGGMVLFYLMDWLFSGTFPSGPFFIILASPGLLFLYCGLQDQKTSSGA